MACSRDRPPLLPKSTCQQHARALLCRWRRWERKLRTFAVWGAFLTLALFYLIPISAVQSLIQASWAGQGLGVGWRSSCTGRSPVPT